MTNDKMNSQEIQEEKRKRQMAILKASNELLRQSKETAMKRNSDPIKRAELEKQFARAMDDNRAMGRSYLHATEEEIENSKFREVDPLYIEKYNERLQKKGLTDEELHRKDEATITTNKNKKGKKGESIPRRPRRGAKKDESEIVRLENEDELMKSTMVKSEKEIEEHMKKNREYEQEMIKKGKDVFEKVKETVKESSVANKIGVTNEENIERVKVENSTVNNIKQPMKVQNTTVKETVSKKKKVENIKYDFDFSDIPSYVQYDVLPLPSNGQCYPIDSPLRCGRIPVAYLTASDENIITSPNAYRDGKIIDIILERKILDKRINIHDLCSGDREAVVLWLRATSYGDDFPISATNPETGKQYNVVIKLSQFDYNEFGLESDDEGLFDYTTLNGDEIKFRFFTNDDEQELRNKITSQITDINKVDILKAVRTIENSVVAIDVTDEEATMLKEDIDEIKDIIGTDLNTEEAEKVFPNTVTEQMIIHTVSINGNNDREYIKNYIENMRSKDALDYRNYFIDNRPGVDFNFTVNIPESDGGGSFATFLRLDDTVFINF
jgi:hypothetical protein